MAVVDPDDLAHPGAGAGISRRQAGFGKNVVEIAQDALGLVEAQVPEGGNTGGCLVMRVPFRLRTLTVHSSKAMRFAARHN